MDNRGYGPIDAGNNPFQGNARIVDLRGHRRQVSVSDVCAASDEWFTDSLVIFERCIATWRGSACGKLGFIKAR